VRFIQADVTMLELPSAGIDANGRLLRWLVILAHTRLQNVAPEMNLGACRTIAFATGARGEARFFRLHKAW
jgi:hypothetical protein